MAPPAVRGCFVTRCGASHGLQACPSEFPSSLPQSLSHGPSGEPVVEQCQHALDHGTGQPRDQPGKGGGGTSGLFTHNSAAVGGTCPFLVPLPLQGGGPLQKAFPDAPSLPPLRARPCWASCKLLGELGTCLDPPPALHPGFSQFSLHHENGSRCLVSACTHAVRRAPTSLADAVPACPDHAVRKHTVTWHRRLTEEPEAHSPAGMTALTPAPSVSSRSAGECSSGAFGCSAQARRCQQGLTESRLGTGVGSSELLPPWEPAGCPTQLSFVCALCSAPAGKAARGGLGLLPALLPALVQGGRPAPRQLHTAGFCLPRLTLLSPVLLIVLANLRYSGWSHSEPLSPRWPLAHPLPQTLNNELRCHLPQRCGEWGSGVRPMGNWIKGV